MASPYILTSPQRQFPQQFLPQQQYQPRPQPQLPPQRVVPPSPYKPGPQAPPPQFQQPIYRQPQFQPYQPQGIIQQSPNRPPFPVQQRPPVYSSQSLPVGRQPVQGLPPQLQGKPQGVPGPQGIPQGFQGPQGLPQGLQGPPGPQGLQGPPPGHQIPPYGPQGYQQFKPPQGVQGVQPGLIRSQQQPPYPPQRQGPPQPVKPPQPQTQQKPQQQQQKYPNQLAPPPQYKQPQAQLVDNNQQYLNAKKQQDEDLEKKFQEAISRTHDLVNRFQQPQQEPPKQGPPQMMAQQDDPDLVDLALQYEDGYIYRGQGLEPATRQGFGILTDSAEQEVYSGWWHDNQYHGQGKLVNFQSEQIDGPFDYRDLSNIDNGWVGYEGEFFEGKMHGRGLLQLTNNEKFEGTFNDGMIDGQGVFTRIDGQEIRGIWKDGSLVQVQD